MVATHNRESVEKAVALMESVGTTEGVHFAQLLGMRDDLTFNLGNSGYKAYK
jgi:proline dehydrogenase